MQRLAIFVFALAFAAAAPARAWCEAACASPDAHPTNGASTGEAGAHCPSHDGDDVSDVPQLSGGMTAGGCVLTHLTLPASRARLDVPGPELTTSAPALRNETGSPVRADHGEHEARSPFGSPPRSAPVTHNLPLRI